jgi:cell wall-associated NlpC family hydrolase
MEWARKYIGIPFREKGRDEDGLDCWGLVRLVFKEERGIVLPSYDESYSSTEDSEAIEALVIENKTSWQEVPAGKERPWDVVLLRLRGRPMHVGLVTAPGFMLHITRETFYVAHESYRAAIWRSKILGFYRYAP